MKKRFIELWKALGVTGSNEITYDNLYQLYNAPERYYHNTSHIKKCLVELDACAHLVTDKNALELALFYHDAIYMPGSDSNEELSAELAARDCIDFKLPPEFTEKVEHLILMTTHDCIPDTDDGKYMIDIDLSILGAAPEEFDAYEQNIAGEYAFVDKQEYKKGRCRVLNNFLNRSFIYFSDYYRDKYEKQARANLVRSIKRLCRQ